MCYDTGVSLRDEIKTVTGNKRKFLLLRIVDMDTRTAINLCGIQRGTYNTWLQDPEFIALYRRRSEFSGEYKQEAIQLLRRDNQLEAVLLEGKLIGKMKSEIENGEYELIIDELLGLVSTEVTVEGHYQSDTWMSVFTINGLVYREPGKPIWAAQHNWRWRNRNNDE